MAIFVSSKRNDLLLILSIFSINVKFMLAEIFIHPAVPDYIISAIRDSVFVEFQQTIPIYAAVVTCNSQMGPVCPFLRFEERQHVEFAANNIARRKGIGGGHLKAFVHRLPRFECRSIIATAATGKTSVTFTENAESYVAVDKLHEVEDENNVLYMVNEGVNVVRSKDEIWHCHIMNKSNNDFRMERKPKIALTTCRKAQIDESVTVTSGRGNNGKWGGGPRGHEVERQSRWRPYRPRGRTLNDLWSDFISPTGPSVTAQLINSVSVLVRHLQSFREFWDLRPFQQSVNNEINFENRVGNIKGFIPISLEIHFRKFINPWKAFAGQTFFLPGAKLGCFASCILKPSFSGDWYITTVPDEPPFYEVLNSNRNFAPQTIPPYGTLLEHHYYCRTTVNCIARIFKEFKPRGRTRDDAYFVKRLRQIIDFTRIVYGTPEIPINFPSPVFADTQFFNPYTHAAHRISAIVYGSSHFLEYLSRITVNSLNNNSFSGVYNESSRHELGWDKQSLNRIRVFVERNRLERFDGDPYGILGNLQGYIRFHRPVVITRLVLSVHSLSKDHREARGCMRNSPSKCAEWCYYSCANETYVENCLTFCSKGCVESGRKSTSGILQFDKLYIVAIGLLNDKMQWKVQVPFSEMVSYREEFGNDFTNFAYERHLRREAYIRVMNAKKYKTRNSDKAQQDDRILKEWPNDAPNDDRDDDYHYDYDSDDHYFDFHGVNYPDFDYHVDHDVHDDNYNNDDEHEQEHEHEHESNVWIEQDKEDADKIETKVDKLTRDHWRTAAQHTRFNLCPDLEYKLVDGMDFIVPTPFSRVDSIKFMYAHRDNDKSLRLLENYELVKNGCYIAVFSILLATTVPVKSTPNAERNMSVKPCNAYQYGIVARERSISNHLTLRNSLALPTLPITFESPIKRMPIQHYEPNQLLDLRLPYEHLDFVFQKIPVEAPLFSLNQLAYQGLSLLRKQSRDTHGLFYDMTSIRAMYAGFPIS